MSSDLFREEALEFQSASNSRFGKPTAVLPPSWILITCFLGLFIAALVIFLFTVEFARKETVRGKLRVDGAEAKILALEPGIITSVLVEDGELVEAGAIIAEITSERYMQGGTALSDVTIEQLKREQQALERRQQAIIKSAALGAKEALQRLTDAQRREREGSEQLAVVERRLGIAEARAADAEQFLAEGLIAEPQLNERLDTVAQLEQSVLQVEAQVSESVAAQDRARLEKLQVEASSNRELADLDQRLEQIRAEVQRTTAQRAHIVRSPIKGKITALQARTGEQSIPGVPLAVVLPENSSLIAEVYLPSRAIGFVIPGQEVKLQYDAFPYQKFGIAYGTVEEISDTAQLPSELGIYNQSVEPLYKVSIQLAKQRMRAFSTDVALQAGMELTADIVLENRRLLEWLLEPLAAKS